MRLRYASIIAGAALLAATQAHAGQVRVSVSSNQFSPANVAINPGDHVVWVWLSGNHSVTSGADGTPDDKFDSGIQPTGTANANTAFNWKSDVAGAVPYFCIPHFPDMTGTITVQAGSSAPVADFRITEVLYNAAGNADLIEITNVGTAAGDLGRYRIAIPGDVEGLPIASVTVAANGIVTIHPGATGTNSATEIYVPLLNTLPDDAGSVALYVPATIAGETSLTDEEAIIDFVQYGAGGQANQGVATIAGLWTAGQFVATVGEAGRSIEFCGNRTDRGATNWAEINPPNFGSDGNCVTPTRETTWGRVKTLYR